MEKSLSQKFPKSIIPGMICFYHFISKGWGEGLRSFTQLRSLNEKIYIT